VNRNSLRYSISICRHPRYSATKCVEQRVQLRQSFYFVFHMGCLFDFACLIGILFVRHTQTQCYTAGHTTDITLQYHKHLLVVFCYTHMCIHMHVYMPNKRLLIKISFNEQLLLMFFITHFVQLLVVYKISKNFSSSETSNARRPTPA
jgi:hypothetical protein